MRYSETHFHVDHPNVVEAKFVYDWHNWERKAHVTLKKFSRVHIRDAMRSVGEGLERLGKGFPNVIYKAA